VLKGTCFVQALYDSQSFHAFVQKRRNSKVTGLETLWIHASQNIWEKFCSLWFDFIKSSWLVTTFLKVRSDVLFCALQMSYDVFTIPRLGKCPGTVQDMAGRQQMSRSWVSAGEIALMSFRIYQCQDQSISVANTLYNFVSLSSATYSHVLLIIIIYKSYFANWSIKLYPCHHVPTQASRVSSQTTPSQ